MNRTNQRLIENIQKNLDAKKWKIPKLAKATGLSASGLYGVMDGTRWPGPDNLERIAKALDTTPGKLLEQPPGMEAEPQPPSKEELLIAIFQGSLKLSDSQLRVILDQIEIAIEGVDEDDFLDSSDDMKSGS